MNYNLQNPIYEPIINKIKRRKKLVVILGTIAILAVLFLTTPSKIVILNEPIIDYKGLPTIVTVLLFLLCSFVAIIANAIVSLPLNTSMDQECDPEKHLVLNIALSKQNNLDPVYVLDYFYLGEYQKSLEYAQKIICSPKNTHKLVGLFNKARCEFMLGKYDELKQTEKEYYSLLSSSAKLKGNALSTFQKIHKIILFMIAISDNDCARLKELYTNIEIWNRSKITEGLINYLKGVASNILGDKEETVYRLKSVQETCSKTILAILAEESLSTLR